MKKIMFIPLDERPCNYNYAKFLLEDNKDIEDKKEDETLS